jgi:hypothetical protein
MSEELAQQHLDTWPDVQPHAIDQDQGEQETGGQSTLTDVDGNVFDPEVYVADADGNPKYTKHGRFKKRPRRKAKTGQAVGGGGDGLDLSAVQGGDTGQEAQISAEQAAVMTVQLIMAAGMYLDPQEGKPGKDVFGRDEFQSGVHAWKSCYEYYGISYIPPWLAPTIWTMAYFGKRIVRSQEAQGKVAAVWAYLKKTVFRNPFRKRRDNARNDSGDDGKR